MKKHYFLTLLTILFISIAMIGCKFSYSEPSGKLADSLDNSALSIAARSLQFIQKNETDSLKGLFNEKVIRMVKPEQLDWLMQEGQKVLKEYTYPNDTNILKSKTTNYSMGGKKVIEMLSFPFQNKINKDSLKYFHITVINNEIYRFLINDYPPGRSIIEPKHNEPHLNKINMQTDNISWFRIWYDDGSKINRKYGNNIGYYAVSGQKKELIEIGMKKQFQETFNLINAAKFDSLDFKYMRENEIGDPEWIYLRLKFDNEEYKNLGEFEISYFIDEEDTKKEIMSDYVIFKHTDKTRYLLLKNKNPELVQKLMEIAHHDYGKYYDRNP